MQPNSWTELRAAFEAKFGEWTIQYPSPPFVEMIIKRCYHYYAVKKPENMPASPQAWERAIARFLKEDWEKRSTQASAGQSARALPVGKRSLSAVAIDPHLMLRKELDGYRGKDKDVCPKCLGLGTVGMFEKPHMSYYAFLCNCAAAAIASRLPENARMVCYTAKDPEHWQKDF